VTVSYLVPGAAQPPTVSIITPPHGASYGLGQLVHASFSCSEGESGPGLLPGAEGCAGSVENGALIDTSVPGLHSFVVTAKSQDAQQAKVTNEYTVREAESEGPASGGGSTQGGSSSNPTAELNGLPPAGNHGLVLSAAGSTNAASYTFQLGSGGQPIKCPGQDPVLNTLVANNVTATATVTVTSLGGATATASTPISNAIGTLPKLKLQGAFGAPSAHIASQTLGPVQALASECLPAAGNSSSPGHAQSVHSVIEGETAPTTSGSSGGCLDTVTVGIIQGVGCFTKVEPGHPLPAAEQTILCGHFNFGCVAKKEKIPFPPSLFEPQGGATGARAALSAEELGETAFDAVYYSMQPIRVNGVEIDPVNHGAIVLARAGLLRSVFLKSDSAYLISSDAVVKVAGIPVSVHVPDYIGAYEKGKAGVECAKSAVEGIESENTDAANCLGSVKLPSVSQAQGLIPSDDGPIDLSVSPEDLGVELGEFTVPGSLPIPNLQELPISGSVKVSLTGPESASLAVHVQLPGVLSDGKGHGLTGDTTLQLSNAHGLEVSFLHIKVPSLSQIGLARLKNLEFTYSKPTSLFEGKATLDLGDVIRGQITVALTFQHGSFEKGHIDYTAPPGEGYPLFGPVFLTYVGADVTLNPTKFNGLANLSIGPAVVAGCGALGAKGTLVLTFPEDGSPLSLDSEANVLLGCAEFGSSSNFHADSDGHVKFGLNIHYGIPGLGGVSAKLEAQAVADLERHDYEAQLDGEAEASFHVNECVEFVCTGDINFTQGASATFSIGDRNGTVVGGAGVCVHYVFPVLGDYDVGAGISELPRALSSLGAGDLAAVASHFELLLSNCHLSAFRLLPPPAGFARARGHAAAAYPIHVARGSGDEVIGIQGVGGAPQATLSGPGGATVQAVGEGVNVSKYGLYVRQPSTGQAIVEIPRSEAGSWTLQIAAGSPPIHSVEVAEQLPEPKIKTRVLGRGARRRLAYSLTRQSGLTVRFLEGFDGGVTPIGQARGSRGVIAFTPSLGSSKRRTIIAETIRDGRLSASTVVGRYLPGTIRPGRPANVLARHTGRGWVISFRPGANTTEELLTIRFADGSQILLAAPAREHSVSVPPTLDRTRPTAIQVVGLRGSTRGPAATVVAKLVRRRR
jgi:hypothetical protein